jgi:hypothetical protein
MIENELFSYVFVFGINHVGFIRKDMVLIGFIIFTEQPGDINKFDLLRALCLAGTCI